MSYILAKLDKELFYRKTLSRMDGQNYLETILADLSSFQEQKADERETLFETYLAT